MDDENPSLIVNLVTVGWKNSWKETLSQIVGPLRSRNNHQRLYRQYIEFHPVYRTNSKRKQVLNYWILTEVAPWRLLKLRHTCSGFKLHGSQYQKNQLLNHFIHALSQILSMGARMSLFPALRFSSTLA